MYIDFLTDSITRLVQIANNYKPHETEHNIAIQMLQHLSVIPNCSVQEVADMCFCSVATISRFVKKLNFENFSTFKYKLASDLFNSPKLNLKMPTEYLVEYNDLTAEYLNLVKSQIDEMKAGLSMEMVERAIQLMHDAETIVLYSHGDLDLHTFQADLALHGKASWHIKGYDEMRTALDTLGEDTLVVAPLFPTQNGKHNVEQIKARGMKMVIISRGNVNVYEKYADAFFQMRMSETKLDDYLIHMLFDILSMHYRKKYFC